MLELKQELEHFDEFINQNGCFYTPGGIFYKLSNEENMRKVLTYCNEHGLVLCTKEPLNQYMIEHLIYNHKYDLSQCLLLGYMNKANFGAKSPGVYFYNMCNSYTYYKHNFTIYEPTFTDYNVPKTNLLNWIEGSK